MSLAIGAIRALFSLYSLALILRVPLEMILGPYHGVVRFLRLITEPVLRPIRRYVKPVQSGGMAWDLSPVIAFLVLWVLVELLTRLLIGIAF